MVMNEFTRAFDNHMRIPKKVPGRGKRYATELWLDARDMSSIRAFPFTQKKKNKKQPPVGGELLPANSLMAICHNVTGETL